MTTITVCRTCRIDRTDENPIRDGYRLLTAVAERVRASGKSETISVRSMACMSACKMGCAAQITGPDRFTYVLATLDPDTTVDDLIAFAETHAEKEHGLVIKSQRPEAIKDHVIARVPPAGFQDFPVEVEWPRVEDASA